MALNPTGPLERAVEAARAEDQDDRWQSVAESVKDKIRASITPSRPVVVVEADGTTDQDDHGSRTYVGSRVVRSAVREALRTRPDLTAERIDLTVDDDDRLAQVEVDIVCAYGTVLTGAAAEARVVVETIAADLLGTGTRPVVDVTVSDVVVGDPRLI